MLISVGSFLASVSAKACTIAVHGGSDEPGTHVELDTCRKSAAGQDWTLGQSGRLFSRLSAGRCVTANVPKWAGFFRNFLGDDGVLASP